MSRTDSIYEVFGLRIQSNQIIPEFAPLAVASSADVQVSLGCFPDHLDRALPPIEEAMYVSDDAGENGEPSSRVWSVRNGQYFRLLYSDGTDCVVDRAGTRIWISWPESLSLVDVVPYLQGQLMGLVLRLRGVTCLHASSILIGDQAIAFTGPAGSGKSTTAAAFLKMGYPVMADDVTPVFEEEGRFFARPAHPRIWLCPEMVETLYGKRDALPQYAPTWEKRYINMNAAGPGMPVGPRPLAAIFVLSNRENEPRRPLITQGAPRDILLHLLCNTYINHLLEPEMRSREFALLSRLLETVPVVFIHPHEDASRIPLLCQTILDEVARCFPSAGRNGVQDDS